MDHAEVREILEDAAIEPGGLERLMAGDTASGSLVAGHLAGCPECSEELARLHRSVGLIGPAIRAVPPPELRERTLAFVAAVGRPRGAVSEVLPERPIPAASATPANADPTRPTAIASRRALRVAPLLAVAAAIVLAVGGTALVANASRDAELRHQAAEIEALGDVARGTLRLDAEPDVHRVALTGAVAPGGSGITGQLIYSPSSTEVVVVADGLPPAAAGHEYRCWVEQNGQRKPIGKMFFGGSLAYWVGPAPAISALGPSATFGISLVDLTSGDTRGQQVLAGAS